MGKGYDLEETSEASSLIYQSDGEGDLPQESISVFIYLFILGFITRPSSQASLGPVTTVDKIQLKQ